MLFLNSRYFLPLRLAPLLLELFFLLVVDKGFFLVEDCLLEDFFVSDNGGGQLFISSVQS